MKSITPTDEQRLLIKIGNIIDEPVTIEFLDYFPDEKKIRFNFPDDFHVMVDNPINIENIEKEIEHIGYMVKKMRKDHIAKK